MRRWRIQENNIVSSHPYLVAHPTDYLDLQYYVLQVFKIAVR